VEEALASRAYDNVSLPIGHGQTISQPLTVAQMTSALLQGPPLRRVLEIGTGSGYQTAVLAALVPEVVSIERISALAAHARRVLRDLGLRNVALVVGDGSDLERLHRLKVNRAPTTLRVSAGGAVDDVGLGLLDPIRLGELFKP